MFYAFKALFSCSIAHHGATFERLPSASSMTIGMFVDTMTVVFDDI